MYLCINPDECVSINSTSDRSKTITAAVSLEFKSSTQLHLLRTIVLKSQSKSQSQQLFYFPKKTVNMTSSSLLGGMHICTCTELKCSTEQFRHEGKVYQGKARGIPSGNLHDVKLRRLRNSQKTCFSGPHGIDGPSSISRTQNQPVSQMNHYIWSRVLILSFIMRFD